MSDDQVINEDVPNVDPYADLRQKARAKGYATSADDVRKMYKREPLTQQEILQAINSPPADFLEVTDATTDEEITAYLFSKTPNK